MHVLHSRLNHQSLDLGRLAIRWVVPGLALVLGLAGLFVTARYRYIQVDEIETVHAAWKLATGAMIFRDFFEHHHPLNYMVISWLLEPQPKAAFTVIWLRLLNLGVVALILATTFELTRRLFDARAGLAATVLLAAAPFFSQKAIELRPDVPQTAFGLAALLLLIPGLQRGRWPWAMAAGLALGLAFAALQKAVFLVIAVGLIAGLRWLSGQVRFRELAALAAGFLLALVPFVVWLVANGAWSEFWLFNYGLNAAQTYVAVPTETLRKTPRVFFTLVNSLTQSPLLWGFFAVGLLTLISQPTDPAKRWWRLELAFVAVVLLAWVIVLNKYFTHYYLPALPLVAVFAGGAFAASLRDRPLVFSVLLAVSGFAALGDAVRTANNEPNSGQLERIDRVLALTRADDPVLDGRNQFNLFRPDVDFFWFNTSDDGLRRTYEALTGESYDPFQRIEEMNPAVVNLQALSEGTSADDPRLSDFGLLEGTEDILVRADRLGKSEP
ncbi:MAG: glycosyltransferase family 39 protein [Geminicoccaceae bacterium]